MLLARTWCAASHRRLVRYRGDKHGASILKALGHYAKAFHQTRETARQVIRQNGRPISKVCITRKVDVEMITGECFCGSITYQITAPLTKARACHCSRCRKAFSGPSSAYAELSHPESFRWIKGAEKLITYTSQAKRGLQFCGTCGTTLCGVFDGKIHGITLGTVNGDPGVEIEKHIYIGSKAPWDHIGGPAPQFIENEK